MTALCAKLNAKACVNNKLKMTCDALGFIVCIPLTESKINDAFSCATN